MTEGHQQSRAASTVCICGRLSIKIHCPTCGSYSVYGIASKRDRITRPDGKVVDLNVYKCRRCLTTFNDDEWRLHCHAPDIEASKPNRGARVMQQQVRYDSVEDVPEDMRLALDEIKRKRGI